MTVIPCLLLLMISFVLDTINGTQKAYYSTKTPYKPPLSTLILPLPPTGFELVCTQIVARHGCRTLEGQKYDKLTMALWTQAKDEDALTEYGHQLGEDLQYFIAVNNKLGRGELSGLGKIEHQSLAQRLTERLLPFLNNFSNRIQVVSSGSARTIASLHAFVQGLPSSLTSSIDYEPSNPTLLYFHQNLNYQIYYKKDRQLKTKLRSIEMQPYSKQMARNVLKRLYKQSFIDRLTNGYYSFVDDESGKSIKNEVDAVRMLHGLYLIGPNLRKEGVGDLLEKYFHQNESAWFAYLLDAKSLYDSLETLDKDDWQTLINIQRMWMGECNGVNILFKLSIPTNEFDFIETFTIKPETLLNITHLYIRSNHKLARPDLIEETQTGAKRLRADAIHPLTERLLPIFINDDADYGPKIRANMPMLNVQIGTPISNEFDETFANKHNVSTLIDSSTHWHGMNLETLLSELRSRELGGYQTSGKLNDWCISRQRYWGTPIPIIHCNQCGTVPVPENELPVQLPSIENIKSSSKKGISPLANAYDWIKTPCPKCGNPNAQRETDTMDTFVDSSWYFLRYLDNENTSKPFEPNIVNKLMPVDLYIGGLEHALTHLFVARFVQHFMYSKGLCNSIEPFKRFIPIGMVQGKTYKTSTGQYVTKDNVLIIDKNTMVHSLTKESLEIDWEKMSKSKYNGIDPQEIIDQYGVDFTRILMLNFVHPRSLRNFTLEDGIAEGLQNWFKILIHLYVELIENRTKSSSIIPNEEFKQIEIALREQRLNAIYNVTFYIDSFFSVASAIIELQKLTRYLRKIPVNVKQQSNEYLRSLCDLLVMIGPFIPFLSSELWTILQKQIKINIDGYDLNQSLFEQTYPILTDDYPGKINALFDTTVFASMPISRSILPNLSMTDVLQYLNENDNQSQMKLFIEKNGLKLDRLRKLGDYCATLVYERDPNVIIIEEKETEPIIEKKKSKISKKKHVS